ncbi:hypothetical protein GW17_00017920 [Ensete ventricosum]|nr:hypothetical protein GW17_00017920 [Ensete ventricosum]
MAPDMTPCKELQVFSSPPTCHLPTARMLVTTHTHSNTATPPLLPCPSPYNIMLRSFQSCLRWMCINQTDARHAMVSRSLFLLSIFVPTASHFVLSYAPPIVPTT